MGIEVLDNLILESDNSFTSLREGIFKREKKLIFLHMLSNFYELKIKEFFIQMSLLYTEIES